MTSTRLPGKVLKTVLGRPLLQYMLDRLRTQTDVGVLVATTTNASDDPIVDLCKSNQIECFRGSEHNVLQRYFLAAEKVKADPVIRITSDCPLLDVSVILDCLELYGQSQQFDFVSNCERRTYPRGYDVELFPFAMLKLAYEKATDLHDQEHVTPYIMRNTAASRHEHLVLKGKDLSSYRLTVDTPEDFELIRRILEAVYPKSSDFTLADVMKVLLEHPDWNELNRHVEQKHE